MKHPEHWLWLPALVAPAVVTAPAYAVLYFTVEQAQQALFPAGARFTPHSLELSAEQKRAIEQASGVRVRGLKPKVWRALDGERPAGWFLVDEVIGKHEFITYAVALDASGAVRGIEILDYRETHGGQVRDPKWRAQFTGKRAGAPLKLDEDIVNISGATLSCKHIADGVKRLLATHATALK